MVFDFIFPGKNKKVSYSGTFWNLRLNGQSSYPHSDFHIHAWMDVFCFPELVDLAACLCA